MTVQHTYHSRVRTEQRHITDDMIQATLEKLNLTKLVGHKAYIIDKTLDYLLIIEVYNYFLDIITTITEHGYFSVTGKNSLVVVL
jgi:hypothetical protein